MVSGTLLASLLLLFLNILVIDTHMDVFIYRIEANVFFSAISSNYSQVARLVLLTNTVHSHPLHCDPDSLSPALLLPMETSEVHAIQCQRL